MTDHHHGAGLPALPPDDTDEIVRAFSAAIRRTNDRAEIVRAFAAALRLVREAETEKLWLTVYKLELFHEGMVALTADMRAGRFQTGRARLRHPALRLVSS
jgi:hypothetical protein